MGGSHGASGRSRVSAAYLIYQESIVNIIQAGGNTISITEEFEPPKKQEIGDNVFKKRVQIEKTWKRPVLSGFYGVFRFGNKTAGTDQS